MSEEVSACDTPKWESLGWFERTAGWRTLSEKWSKRATGQIMRNSKYRGRTWGLIFCVKRGLWRVSRKGDAIWIIFLNDPSGGGCWEQSLWWASWGGADQTLLEYITHSKHPLHLQRKLRHLGTFYPIKVNAEKIVVSAPQRKSFFQFAVTTAFAQTSLKTHATTLMGAIPRSTSEVPPEREWLPTSVFWPGDFCALYNPWGHKQSDMTEQFSLHFLQGQAAAASPWLPPGWCHPGPSYQQVQDRWRLASHKTKDSRQLIITSTWKSLGFRSRERAQTLLHVLLDTDVIFKKRSL